ncbi:MAG: S41 family peptidase [Pseudomonadota bacterium]
MRISFMVVAVLIAVGAFSFPRAFAQDKLYIPDRSSYEWAELLSEVIDKVRRIYVDEVTDEQLFEAAINGILYDLDPHSAYLDEESYQDSRTTISGKFGGLGIEITLDESGFVRVITPIDDTPAARAGMQPNDLITHIDSEVIQGQTLREIVDQLRGEPGEPVMLTVFREDQESFDVTIIRDVIRVQSVRSWIQDEIAVLRVTSFNGNAADSLQKAIAALEEQNPIGYILDLRNNPGGLLDQAIKISDIFLDRGEVVSTKGRSSNDVRRYYASDGDLTGGKFLVVLINSGSASASEIVAGALQDHGRAIVLGTKSFGKGSVQTIVPLKNRDVALKLTTQLYYTPSGVSIQAKGIEPDINVVQSRITELEGPAIRTQENNLPGHLQVGDTNGERDQEGVDDDADRQDASAPQRRDLSQDYQMLRAFDLLRALHISHQHLQNENIS